MKIQQTMTSGGVRLHIHQQLLNYEGAIEPLIDHLDTQRGALFASSFEFPGRYTCWDIGFYNPPLVFTCIGKTIHAEALNQRGNVLEERSHQPSVLSLPHQAGLKIIHNLMEMLDAS